MPSMETVVSQSPLPTTFQNRFLDTRNQSYQVQGLLNRNWTLKSI